MGASKSKGIPVEAVAARKAQHARNIGELDYRRGVLRLKQSGLPQAVIAELLMVSQPNVQKMLQRAGGLSMPRDGFTGANPYEICERYAAGLIERVQLVDELTRWEYAPRDRAKDEPNDFLFEVPGSVDDLDRALKHGLIDSELHDEICARNEARKTAD